MIASVKILVVKACFEVMFSSVGQPKSGPLVVRQSLQFDKDRLV